MKQPVCSCDLEPPPPPTCSGFIYTSIQFALAPSFTEQISLQWTCLNKGMSRAFRSSGSTCATRVCFSMLSSKRKHRCTFSRLCAELWMHAKDTRPAITPVAMVKNIVGHVLCASSLRAIPNKAPKTVPSMCPDKERAHGPHSTPLRSPTPWVHHNSVELCENWLSGTVRRPLCTHLPVVSRKAEVLDHICVRRSSWS